MQYIDTVTPTLNSLIDAGRLIEESNKNRNNSNLQLAQLYRSMGENKNSENALRSVENTGILGAISNIVNRDKEWKPDGAFNEFNPQSKDLIKEPALNAQQGILKELQSLYGDDKQGLSDYNKNMQSIASDITNRKIQETNAGSNQVSGIVKSALSDLRSNDTAIKDYNNVKFQNERINDYNANLKPVYSNSYKGDETEQSQNLIDDTIKAVKSGGGLVAYNRYITTGRTLADHYGHDFKALAPEYFGINKSKGSGSGKSDYYLYGDNEQVIEIPSWAMKTSANREAYISKNYPDIYVKGLILKKAGSNSGESLNPLQKEQLKASANENDMMFKAAAAQAWNEADPDGINIFNKKERAELANRSLPSDNPYKFDENGNIVRGNGNVAVKPWK